MNDNDIIELFWQRNESAIDEAHRQYNKYCLKISFSILQSEEDAEECVNDTFLSAWQSIPPNRPNNLSGYLGKLTRNISLDKLRKDNASKRQHSYILVFDELENILSEGESPQDALDEKMLAEKINEFLRSLSYKKRMLFIGRYWNMLSITELSREYGIRESAIKTILHRLREELKKYLTKEGFGL